MCLFISELKGQTLICAGIFLGLLLSTICEVKWVSHW